MFTILLNSFRVVLLLAILSMIFFREPVSQNQSTDNAVLVEWDIDNVFTASLIENVILMASRGQLIERQIHASQ